jgi:hypothetical protein
MAQMARTDADRLTGSSQTVDRAPSSARESDQARLTHVIGSIDAYCAIRFHSVLSMVGPVPDQYAGIKIPSEPFAFGGSIRDIRAAMTVLCVSRSTTSASASAEMPVHNDPRRRCA